MMRFAQPWLLAFGVPLVLFVLLRLRRLPPSLVGARRRFVQACLALGALAGLMAAAGLELGHPVDRMAVVFVVDRSRSVVAPGDPSADSLDAVRAALGTLAQDDAAGVLMEANHDAVVATAMLDAAREYRERGGSLMVCVFVVHSCSSTTKVRSALWLLT